MSCVRMALPLYLTENPFRKKRAAIFLKLTHFCFQCNLMSPGIPAQSVASICPYSHDKGVHKPWLNNFRLLNSLQVSSSSCKNEFLHKWLPTLTSTKKREWERKGEKTNTYLLSTYCKPRSFTQTGSFNLLNLWGRGNHPQSTNEERETEIQVFPHYLEMANLDNEPHQQFCSAGYVTADSMSHLFH